MELEFERLIRQKDGGSWNHEVAIKKSCGIITPRVLQGTSDLKSKRYIFF
jgi:hypothetical protein